MLLAASLKIKKKIEKRAHIKSLQRTGISAAALRYYFGGQPLSSNVDQGAPLRYAP